MSPAIEEAGRLIHRGAASATSDASLRHPLAGRRLVLAAHGAAHGAGRDSDANRAVRALADGLCRGHGLRVDSVFHLGEPGFASLEGTDAVVLPLLTSRGYFYRRLEEAIGDGPTLLPPLGEHPETHAVIVRELLGRVKGAAQSELGVLVVGHGTRRHASSGETTRHLATVLGQALPAARVEVAFLDQEPQIAGVAARLVAKRRVIATVPFLLGRASHAREDIDAAFDGLRPDTRIELPPLLDLPQLPQLIADIATERFRELARSPA